MQYVLLLHVLYPKSDLPEILGTLDFIQGPSLTPLIVHPESLLGLDLLIELAALQVFQKDVYVLIILEGVHQLDNLFTFYLRVNADLIDSGGGAFHLGKVLLVKDLHRIDVTGHS